MTNNQIILNILILSAFIAYIGWTKLMPHFLAYKASNDERVISGILSLKNSFRCELGNSIIIRQGLNSYIPTLKMDVQSVVNIKDLLNSLGYKKPISIALLLATAFIYEQLQFMQNKNLGVNTQQLLVIRGPEIGRDSTYKSRRTAFWNTIAAQSFVSDYANSGTIPGNYYNFSTSGFTQPGSKKGDELNAYSFAIIDNRYLSTYQIPIIAGRSFTESEVNVEWNDNSKVMLNEKAVEQLGFATPEDALRTKIQWDERQLEVIGVVKNYHHTGLQHAIDPIIFYPQNNSAYFSLRISTNQLQSGVASLEKIYKTNFPNNPFEYFFADENFNKQYVTEKQYSHLFITASIWAILIACLGLFGLATYTVESRTKEIGVRKVLGASVLSITKLLSVDFLKLVVISFVIASPIAWFVMSKWLEDFAYRIDISWGVFALAGLMAILIALITVSSQAIKAALSNPVKSLRTQ